MQAHIVTGDGIRHTRDVDELRQAHAAGRMIWVDLEERTPELDRLLAETFEIHPVAAEDIWVDRRVPKVEAFDKYLHILVHGAKRGAQPTQVEKWTLSIVLGKTFVITHRGAAGGLPEGVNADTLLREGPARLAHVFLDRLVDGHVALIEDMTRQVAEAERAVTERTTHIAVRPFASGLFELRRSMQTLARLARRQLSAIEGLQDGRFAFIPNEMIPYYRDVFDHFVRVSDLIDDCQEAVNNTLEAVVQVQSARINSVMKTLTVLSTVMLPLTFIASLFGMNFVYLPATHYHWGFIAVLGLMAVTAIVFVMFFKRRGVDLMVARTHSAALARTLAVALASVCAVACSKRARPAAGPPVVDGSGKLDVKKMMVPHRPAALTCPPRPPGAVTQTERGDCKTDAECSKGARGRCLGIAHEHDHFPGGTNTCTYDACQSDGDCGAASVCDCGSQGASCTPPGNCKLDAECASGVCSQGPGFPVDCNPSYDVWFCRTTQDTCVHDEDCEKSGHPRSVCAFQPALGHWSCAEPAECKIEVG